MCEHVRATSAAQSFYGLADLANNINSLLDGYLKGIYSSSAAYPRLVYVTVHSGIQYSGWDSNTYYVSSTAIIDIPSRLWTNFDTTSSDASDCTYLFSTPFVIVSSMNGVSTAVLKIRVGGSEEYGAIQTIGTSVVSATSLTTSLDSHNVVNGYYDVRYAEYC